MSESQVSVLETPTPDLHMDKVCSYSHCPAPSRVVVYVGGGEVYLCAHDARANYDTMTYPAFWKGSDIPFDKENWWEGPKPEPEPEPVIEEDDEDDEEDEEDDDE